MLNKTEGRGQRSRIFIGRNATGRTDAFRAPSHARGKYRWPRVTHFYDCRLESGARAYHAPKTKTTLDLKSGVEALGESGESLQKN